jgi:hypothetical protein
MRRLLFRRPGFRGFRVVECRRFDDPRLGCAGLARLAALAAKCPSFAMRGYHMIWLGLTLALLPWSVWQVWRSELVRRVYASQEPPALTITPKHVQALRKLRFAWNTAIESGGAGRGSLDAPWQRGSGG